LRPVDKDAQQPGTRAGFEFHQFVPHTDHSRLNQINQLHDNSETRRTNRKWAKKPIPYLFRDTCTNQSRTIIAEASFLCQIKLIAVGAALHAESGLAIRTGVRGTGQGRLAFRRQQLQQFLHLARLQIATLAALQPR